MGALAALFASGHLIDAIAVLTLVEGAVLTAYARRTGRGIAPGRLWPNLLAGLSLLFAVRVALAGESWMWLATCLLAALAAHLADLRARWRRAERAETSR